MTQYHTGWLIPTKLQVCKETEREEVGYRDALFTTSPKDLAMQNLAVWAGRDSAFIKRKP